MTERASQGLSGASSRSPTEPCVRSFTEPQTSGQAARSTRLSGSGRSEAAEVPRSGKVGCGVLLHGRETRIADAQTPRCPHQDVTGMDQPLAVLPHPGRESHDVETISDHGSRQVDTLVTLLRGPRSFQYPSNDDFIITRRGPAIVPQTLEPQRLSALLVRCLVHRRADGSYGQCAGFRF